MNLVTGRTKPPQTMQILDLVLCLFIIVIIVTSVARHPKEKLNSLEPTLALSNQL